ncbi:hypothetical protein [Campylobacter ureolyticus]|uniref:Uncharacterized protein n=1 Tax=Campylobacter ureolyticus TaxID=827 RepID=A0A6N2RVT1_9BACT
MKRSKAEIESEKFWEDVYKEGAKQRRIQEREQRENAKSSSSGGRARGGRSRGYFSSAGKSGRKSLGAGRTSRISSSSYCHKTSVVVKKIHPNSARYNNAKTIGNALNYISGLSENSEQKNENVKMIFFNGNDNFPFKIQENQNQMYIDLFKENLELEKTPPLIQHIVFSLDSQTTKNGKKISREEIANIEEQALVKLAQENEILRNHMILMARHDQQKGQEEEHTNGVHFHILKSNYNTQTMELERDFWTKEQIRNLQIDFAKECQNFGLDVKIPREYKDKDIEIQEEISEKQRQTENLANDQHKVLSIEFFKNGKAKSLILQNLENGEIFTRKDRDIGRFVEQNDIQVDDEFKVNLRIIKETNKKGKEYSTFQWQTPINRKNPTKERQEKEKEILKCLGRQIVKIKEEQEQEIQKENEYKTLTNQTYEGFRSVKFSLLEKKLVIHKETIPNKMKNWNLESLGNILSTLKIIPDFYYRFSEEEQDEINKQKNNWQKKMEQAKEDRKWKQEQEQEEKQEYSLESLENVLNTLKEIINQKKPQQEQQKEQKKREQKDKQREEKEREEKIKELQKDKKIAIERLKKELQPLKQEEDNYKKTTNQTYEGYRSIKVKIYENEIQSLNRDENAGLGDIKSSFELTMSYRKENKNFIYQMSLRTIRSFFEAKNDDIRKQERDWDYEIEKIEEEQAKQEEIQKKKEPKPIEQEYIKKPIERQIEQEPKREFKPKPKKDRGFSR